MSYIVDSSEDLALMYDKYNDEYFDGKLRTDVKIYWSERMKTHWVLLVGML